MATTIKLLRVNEVITKLGISRASLYRRLEQDSTFPRPISLGTTAIRFVEAEIDSWLDARIRACRSEQHSP